jgi:aryl-alcohol dehydrogenase-like predicted oxidoreductase
METRILNGTSLQTSRLALGTMTFGSQVDQSGATEMVRRALDLGITHYDTANAYNGGESERLLGTALGARRGMRCSPARCTTQWVPDRRSWLVASGDTQGHRRKPSRLGTDYLDLYYLHQPDAQILLKNQWVL